VWDTRMHPEGGHPAGRSAWYEYISVVYAPRYFRSDTSIRYLGNFCIPSRIERRRENEHKRARVWYESKEIPLRVSVLPAKGDLLFSNEIDSDAEQAGSTSNKSQWSVEVSISSYPSARFWNREGSAQEMQMWNVILNVTTRNFIGKLKQNLGVLCLTYTWWLGILLVFN